MTAQDQSGNDLPPPPPKMVRASYSVGCKGLSQAIGTYPELYPGYGP